MSRNFPKNHGFTLVELMLAMAFLGSMLSLASAVIIQTFNIYNKGIVTKQMNQAGRLLVEDIIRVGNSGTASIATSLNCVKIDSSVYVWNPADRSGFTSIRYVDSENNPVYFATVNYDNCGAVPEISDPTPDNKIPSDMMTTLVGSGVRVYDFTVSRIPSTKLVYIRLILGSYSPSNSAYNPQMVSGKPQCSASSIGSYCAFTTMETTIYLPNEVN